MTVNPLKISVWLACAAPLSYLVARFFLQKLGVNPVEEILHTTGEWSLRLLCITLAMTPLRTIIRRPWPIQLRRMLGLWSFAYVCVHLSTFVVFDLSFSPTALLEETIERPFITVGMAAWLLLLPLAVTSTNGWQRRLKRRWKTLHQAVYPAILLAVLHYVWLSKAGVEPLIYAAIVCGLFILRLPRVKQVFAART